MRFNLFSRARRGRGLVAAATTVALGVATLGVALSGPAGAAPGCRVDYTVPNDWGTGFTAYLRITNLGDPLAGWALTFTFPGNQRITNAWSANWSQPAGSPNVTATNLDWNRNLGTGQATDIGFNASYTGTNSPPASFAINGVTCTGQPPPTTTTTPTTSTATSTTTATTATSTSTTTSSTTTTSTTTTPPPPGTHLPNPYDGAQGYINPDWAAQVRAEGAATGGTLGQQITRLANNSTAVWMDRIGAITAGRGLAGHLDAALAQDQQNGSAAVVVTVVVYDLPNRDCAALASNGELRISENGLARYRNEYINPIANIVHDPRYANLRISLVVEPDSLPNLVTNASGQFATPDCVEAQQTGAYVQGIQYALNTLRAPNVYLYVDAAHSGWLGWPNNFDGIAALFASTVSGVTGGLQSGVDGFITDTANYTPVEEIHLPNPNLSVGGQPIMSSTFYEWNPRFDELDFAQQLRTALIGRGFSSNIGMLVDTSRNGWGGAARPGAPSTSTNLDTYVNESKLDRRPHRGGWCNQVGAGIGARPVAIPATGLDAFVWVKPPGESDGISEPNFEPDPNDPSKRHDPMCDPDAQNRYNSAFPTNALDNAPHAGRWFPAQLRMLVQNAFPAI